MFLSRFVGAILAFVSCQCLGTLIRTSARLKSNPEYWFDSFEGFLPEDFESFWIGIGTTGILLKSWLSFWVDMEWKSNYEAALGNDEVLAGHGEGIVDRLASYLFKAKTRTAICFVLLMGSAAVVHEYLPYAIQASEAFDRVY